MSDVLPLTNRTTMSPSEATVYVVDDEPRVRQSLQTLFASEGWQVQVFEDGNSFLDAVPKDSLGCVVLDVKLPGMDGHAVHAEMLKRHVSLPVVFYTACGTVRDATQAMKRGAVDFMEKSDGPEYLIDSVQQALVKHNQAIERIRQVRQIQDMLATLTPRENEVLTLVMEGQTSREIANQLHRSEKTIQLHRANIMKKFNVRRVVDLINLVMASREAE